MRAARMPCFLREHPSTFRAALFSARFVQVQLSVALFSMRVPLKGSHFYAGAVSSTVHMFDDCVTTSTIVGL